MDVQALHTDDGIVLRVPDTDDPPPAGIADARRRTRWSRWSPPSSAARRCSRPGSASAPPGRCCCPAASPAGARRCGSSGSAPRSCSRWPARYGTFPIVLETVRECLQDVFDVPALTGLMRDLAARKIRLVEVETPDAVPVRPVAAVPVRRRVHVRGRRAAGRAPRPGARARLRAARRAARPGRPAGAARPRGRRARPSASCSGWPPAGCAATSRASPTCCAPSGRCRRPRSPRAAPNRARPPAGWPSWRAQRRAIEVRIAGEARWAAIEDAGRLRDALGVPLPVGVPVAFTEPVADPLGDLVARYARDARAVHGARRGGPVRARGRRW